MVGTLENVRILHIEDNPGDALLLKAELVESASPHFVSRGMKVPDWQIDRVPNCREAKSRLSRGDIDVVVLDLGLPDGRGMEALRDIALASPSTPIIVLSGTSEPETAFESIHGGAQDYLVKGQADGDQIWRTIHFAVERQQVRNQDTQVLNQSQEGFKALMDMSVDGIVVFREGFIQAVNSAFETILGYTPLESLGRPIGFFCDKEYLPYFQSQLERGVETPMQFLGKKKDGSPVNLEFHLKRCLLKDRPAQVINLRDITDRKNQEEELLRRAYHDPVTDLPNRFLFFDRLRMALQKATRTGNKVGLMFLDLDRFKLINDTLGHSVGDELIKASADRLGMLVGEGHTLARLGGDEFTLLLDEVQGDQDAVRLARKILEGFSKPFQLKNHELHVSTSIGISLYPDDASDSDQLVRRADMAMYRAKEGGRNNFQVYHDSMDTGSLDRLELENSLFKALDNEEFELLYQPQTHLASGRVVGLEALLRWNHPTRGSIPPSEFIPLAEETGFIVPLGQWVIRRACVQAKAWLDLGLPPVRVCINLSAAQFMKHTLPFLIDKVVREVGVDPRNLEFELTESVAMRNPTFTLAAMLEMTKVVKVRIALDDFGVAYSSLGYLKDLPIHSLKVDKSFVIDLGQGGKDEAIVTTIITLANSLGLEIIVEGVENKAQMDFLAKHPGIIVQGFFLHKPLPPKAVETLLRQQR